MNSTERHEVTGDEKLPEDKAKKVEDVVGDKETVKGKKLDPNIIDHPPPTDSNNPNNVNK